MIHDDTTCTKVGKVDEVELNEFFNSLPPESFEKLLTKRSLIPSRKRQTIKNKVVIVPPNLKSSITTLRLLDEQSYERRAEIFIGYCLYKEHTYNTAVRYFSILKRNNVFGTDPINLKPCKIAFANSGKPHVRVVSMDDFVTFIRYLNKNLSRYTAPILLGAHTCLRTNEILQFTTQTLFELTSRRQTVSIRLKQTIVKPDSNQHLQWRPVYNTHLNIFVKNLIALYYEEYAVFIKSGVNSHLFDITPKTISNRTKSLYFNAVGNHAPPGFSNHSIRNMIAMLMARKTDNIIAIQRLLNHHTVKTTRRYIREDFQDKARKEMERLTKIEFANVRRNLMVPTK